MSDIAQLQTEITAAVAAATDEAALEAVRVAALGRKGSVSELLKTLGTMTPEQRREQGPLINGLKDQVTAAIAARREALKAAALDQRLNTETVDVTLPAPLHAIRPCPLSPPLTSAITPSVNRVSSSGCRPAPKRIPGMSSTASPFPVLRLWAMVTSLILVPLAGWLSVPVARIMLSARVKCTLSLRSG